MDTPELPYEAPDLQIVGNLSDLTKSALKPGGDAPSSPNSAFGPDS